MYASSGIAARAFAAAGCYAAAEFDLPIDPEDEEFDDDEEEDDDSDRLQLGLEAEWR
jgi:hypothetical protein